jgi:hypothetical protein
MSNLTKDRLLALVKEFLDKAPSIKPPERREFYAADFDEYRGLPGDRWPEWARKKGVYYLLSDDSEVLYVGERTSWAGVVNEVRENIKRFGKSGLRKEILKQVEESGLNEETIKRLKESGLSERTTKVEAVLFEDSDYYWAVALERFLIDFLHPPLNKLIRQW